MTSGLQVNSLALSSSTCYNFQFIEYSNSLLKSLNVYSLQATELLQLNYQKLHEEYAPNFFETRGTA